MKRSEKKGYRPLIFRPVISWILVGRQDLGGGIRICLYTHFETGAGGTAMENDGACPVTPSDF
jgi:hypothetical protein